MKVEKSKDDNIGFGKKVYVLTNGCPENRIDAARMLEFFKQNGWTETSDFRDADIILFNTCGLTQYSQELSTKIINQLKAGKKSSAELIVCGCLPKINKEYFREIYQGFTFGSDEIERLSEIIETKRNPQEIRAHYLIACTQNPLVDKWCVPNFRKIKSLVSITERLTAGCLHPFNQVINVFRPHTFCIKVSTGCLNACSYCAVRFSRGRVKSKHIHKVEEEFEEGLAKGFKEFALIGTDLGAYGRDQCTTLAGLLRELVKHEGDYEIRLRNIQPRFLIEMMPEVGEIFQSRKIAYFSSAAESGNNRILKLMNRGYRIEDFKEAIRTLNREFPEIQIRTQLMVGFPSETEEEFQDTIRLLDDLCFDYVETYLFQPRPNTRAANMREQIPPDVARRRQYKLIRLCH